MVVSSQTKALREEAETVIQCPSCGSSKVNNDGNRYRKDGSTIKRLSCCVCGLRFSETYIRHQEQRGNRQLCVILQEAKKLDTATESKTVVGDKTDLTDLKGKILEYAWNMKKQGYAETTIRLNQTALNVLMDREANLRDPESVKETIARQNWSPNRKRNVIIAYTSFLKFIGLSWEQPRCTLTRKIPFIPTEQEIDDLIAGNPTTVCNIASITERNSYEKRRSHTVKMD